MGKPSNKKSRKKKVPTSNKREINHLCDTMGLLFSKNHFDHLERNTVNRDAIKFIQLARGLGYYAVCIAGEVHAENTGCFAVGLSDPDPEIVACAIEAANERMRSMRSKGTSWLIDLNDPELQQVAMDAIAQACGHEGPMQ